MYSGNDDKKNTLCSFVALVVKNLTPSRHTPRMRGIHLLTTEVTEKAQRIINKKTSVTSVQPPCPLWLKISFWIPLKSGYNVG